MTTQLFTIDINAPKQTVWDTMLADETYRQWTGAFQEGSYYTGSWDKDNTIRFLADDEGKPSGMLGRIAENIPGEYVSIEYLGEIVDGKDDTTSQHAQEFIGGHENYSFQEQDGVTTLNVEIVGDKISQKMGDMFAEMWPPALQKLKQLCEQSS